VDFIRTGVEAVRGPRRPETRWQSAKARLDEGGLIEIAHTPKFQVPSDAPIFTMGSCFARVIENTLIRLGGRVLLQPHGLPAECYFNWQAAANRPAAPPPTELDFSFQSRKKQTVFGRHGLLGGFVGHLRRPFSTPRARSTAGRKASPRTGHGPGPGKAPPLNRTCFNKYDVHAMSHELKRVLNNEQYENEGLMELADGKWFDPHASSLDLFDLATALRNRKEIHAGTSRIREAEIVIFTLGLTESWKDARTGLAVNAPPPGRWLATRAERFVFVDHGYESILAEFLGLIDLIRRTCNPDMKFIVTVSPIPMSATFRNLDMLVAHAASKSVLRAVAEEAQRRFDYVDYFPAYEIVTHSPRQLVWEEDQMHVARSVGIHVAKQFATAYGLAEI
jgi:hypothetical protein